MQLVFQQRRRNGEVAPINVIDQGGHGQQRHHPGDCARTLAILVVNWEGQVLSAAILSADSVCGKRLLQFPKWAFRTIGAIEEIAMTASSALGMVLELGC